MKTTIYTFLCWLTLISVIPARLQASEKPSSGRKEIIILHVNDMHSKIDNMAKLAYLADSLRQIHPYLFLVSAGDNFTGNPVVDQIPEKGYPMIDLMNRCGFNLSAFGNHEFDMGQDMLNKRLQQAAFRFICCNFETGDAVLKQPKAFHVLKAGDNVRIAFLGLLQLDKNGLPSAHPSNLTGLRFANGIEKAKDYLALKDTFDLLIALSHLGVDDDIVLARTWPQFDVIIGGHTHTVLEKPLTENGVMITQTGANLRYVGKITLTLEDGRIIDKRGELISFGDLKKENLVVRQYIDQYNDNKEFSKVVGHTLTDINGPDELGSLMTDALTHQLHADIALQNKGGIRIHSLEQGDITLKEVFKLDPFNNPVKLFSMTADEIGSLICYGYELMKGIDLQVSGMTYRITDNGHRQCASVELSDLSGKPLEPGKEYLVAVNDYVANTYAFRHKDPGTLSSLTTAEALIRYLGVAGKINYQGTRRAFVTNP